MRVDTNVAVAMRDGVALRADVYRPNATAPVPVLLLRTPYDRTHPLIPHSGIDPEAAVEAGFARRLPGRSRPVRLRGRVPHLRARGRGRLRQRRVGRLAAVVERRCLHGRALLRRGVPVAGGGRAASASRGDRTGRHRQRLLRGLDLPGRRLPARLQPVLGAADGRPAAVRTRSTSSIGTDRSPRCRSPDPKYARIYREWLDHPTDDAYWQTLSINRRYDRVRVPVLNVGGWYDIFLRGTLENFVRMQQEAGSERARRGQRLLDRPLVAREHVRPLPRPRLRRLRRRRRRSISPRCSCGSSPAAARRSGAARIAGPHLRHGRQPLARRGRHGRSHGRATQRWYLHGGTAPLLARLAAGSEEPRRPSSSIRADPAPTVGGPVSLPGPMTRPNAGPLDQRRVEERPDVLVYTSDPLERPLEVVGPLGVTLYAATSATGHGLRRQALRRLAGRGLSHPCRGHPPRVLPGGLRPAPPGRAWARVRVHDRPRRDGERLPGRAPRPARDHEQLVPALRPEPEHGRSTRTRTAPARRARHDRRSSTIRIARLTCCSRSSAAEHVCRGSPPLEYSQLQRRTT